MAKLLNGLFKRGEVYWFRYTTVAGQERISLQTTVLAEAVVKVGQIRANPNKGSGDTVLALITPFLTTKAEQNRFTESTRRSAKLSLEKLASYTSGVPVKSITTETLQKWYNAMRKDSSESTAQTHLNRARSFFRWASKAKLILDNPTPRLQVGRLE